MIEREKLPRNFLRSCKLSLSLSIRRLNDENAEVRREALSDIGLLARHDIYNANCLPRIVELMDDFDEQVRLNSCQALVQMSYCANERKCDEVQLQKAIDLLDDENPAIRFEAADLIGKLALRWRTDNRCLPSLAKMMGGEDEEARLCAFVAQCRLAENKVYDPPILEDAMDILKNEKGGIEMIRAADMIANQAKNGVYDSECLPLLVARLDAFGFLSIEVRTYVCHALNELAVQGIFDPNCLEKIIEQFKIGDIFLSTAAADLIGNLAKNGLYDPKCIPELVDLLYVGYDNLVKDSIMVLGCLDPLLTNEERGTIIETLKNLKADLHDYGIEKSIFSMDQVDPPLTCEERRRIAEDLANSKPYLDGEVEAAARSAIKRLSKSEGRTA